MSARKSVGILLLILFLKFPPFSINQALAAGEIGMGETFPDLPLPTPSDEEHRSYLGLAPSETFLPSQVRAKVLLVEMLNVLCPHCRKQTRPYNQLFEMIENDQTTRGKIKMIGIAVANTEEQIMDFVAAYSVSFPVVADRKFAMHQAIRGGPTPFSIYVLQDPPGEPGIIAGTHLGEDRQMGQLFSYLKDLLDMERSAFLGLAEEPSEKFAVVDVPLPEDELEELIRKAMKKVGGDLKDFRVISLSGGRTIYRGELATTAGSMALFAEKVSRSAICDVCHNVHFFYLFNREGQIVDFYPLHLTKYGNIAWNEAEVESFRHRVVGKKLIGNWQFDPDVDAVSSATMTSAIIFNSLDEAGSLLDELRRLGELR